ncbi:MULTISPECIES: LysR substrate-binding domain-containing protein [Rhizobium]|uniref:LysR substrate-binding domain-containing protein n=1 Tax=Rhizobium TaxID=379 RepID=UPI002180C1A3|nr:MULTISPECIES: LysR substrate-binding domain-containing protein [Rhizobium]
MAQKPSKLQRNVRPNERCVMLDLNDFFYYVQIVDRGGFTAAGRTLRVPKSTLSHRMQELEKELGVRLLNRTSRRFGMTDAGSDFYRHAVAMLREAEMAETTIRHRLTEPTGTVRCTAGVATMQFAMADIIADFLVKYPKVNIFAHAADRTVDIVGENFDLAVRAHSDPLPDSNLVQRTLAPAPWYLFAGTDYIEKNGAPKSPQDLQTHPSLFMMRTGVSPVWRLRHARQARDEVVVPLTPRLIGDDMVGLQQAAIKGIGVVALPGYIARAAVQSGALRRILPDWLAGDSTLTALIPYRQGLLPSVRAFLDHLAAEFPKAVLL